MRLVEDDRICSAWSLFMKSVERTPNKSALIEFDEGGFPTSISYKELHDAARRVASMLVRWSRERKTISNRVGLRVGRSFKYVIGAYGIMLARKSFVPIGLDWPTARVDELKKQLDLEAILDYDSIDPFGVDPPSYHPKLFVTPCVSAEAYCICSSGSTGKPKCIAVSHRAICNLVENQARVFGCGENSRFYWMLSPVFDGALSDMFVALSTGSTLVIGKDFSPDIDFWKEISKTTATHIDIPPSLLAALPEDRMPSCVEALIVGGEQLAAKTVERFSPRCKLINVYGPTEATICTSAKTYENCFQIDQQDVSVGMPFSGVKYKIDPDTSELLISGKQLAIGYVPESDPRAKSLNKSKFLDEDGFGGDDRWFATGDLVKMTSSGEYAVIGRIDRQVKVAGKLVAPEELEAVALSECGLRVAVFKDKLGSLVCALETLDHVDTEKLEEAFKKTVPPWMVPSAFVSLRQKLPTLSSGKLDYGKIALLVEHELQGRVERSQQGHIKLGDRIASRVQQLFQEILHLDFLPEATSSFKQDLNADSISHVMLACKIRQEFGVQLGPCDFKNDDSPSGIAKIISASISSAIPAKVLDGLALKSREKILREIDAISSQAHKAPKIELGATLLTGAAGFLGTHVLYYLQFANPARQIVCLVKARDNEEAREKLVASIKQRHYAKSINLTTKILPIACDLSKDELGLDHELYLELCRNVKHVLHLAGEVNDWKSLDTLAASNVGSTSNIVKFCLESEARYGEEAHKRLVFASTLSVFVADTSLANGGKVFEKPLDECNCGPIASGYAQSKWIAERVVTSSIPDAVVLRYGLLTPPVNHTVFTRAGFSKHNTLGMFFRGAKKLKVLPRPNEYPGLADMSVDLTPVDLAAECTVMAMTSSEKILHVHADMQYAYKRLANLLEKNGIVRLVSDEQFSIARDLYGSDEDVIACVEALARARDGAKYGTFDLFQSTGFTYSRKNLLKLKNGSMLDLEPTMFNVDEYVLELAEL